MTETLPSLTRSRPSQTPSVAVAQIAIACRGDDIRTLVGARWPDRLAEPLGALMVTLSTGDLAALERAAKGAAAGTRYAEARMAHDSERRRVSSLQEEGPLRTNRSLDPASTTIRSISFRRSGRSLNVIGIGAILGRMLPSENAPAAVGMGEP